MSSCPSSSNLFNSDCSAFFASSKILSNSVSFFNFLSAGVVVVVAVVGVGIVVCVVELDVVVEVVVEVA